MKFLELFEQLMKGNQTSIDEFDEGIKRFGEVLNKQEVIRFYVAGTGGFGHQASTINIMKRMIDKFSYSNNIEIIYAESTSIDKTSTESKLELLLPFNKPIYAGGTSQYGTCKSITVIKFKDVDKKLEKDIVFCFTGGIDDNLYEYPKKFKVSYFLRLQPYLWREESSIQVPDKKTIFNFKDLKDNFDIHVYKFDRAKVGVVNDEVWESYEKAYWLGDITKNTVNAKTLYDKLKENEKLKLWPVYGLHAFDKHNSDILLNIVITALQYQKDLNHEGNPIILTLFNNPEDIDFQYLIWFLEDKINKIGFSLCRRLIEIEKTQEALLSDVEKKILEQFQKDDDKLIDAIYELVKNIEQLYKDLNPSEYILNVTSKDVNPDLIKEKINELKKGQILILPIGPVPQPIFNSFYAKAKLPAIFEGQATASLTISLGVPYLKLPKKHENTGSGYPSLLLTELSFQKEPLCANEVSVSISHYFDYFVNQMVSFPDRTDIYIENIKNISAFCSKAYLSDTNTNKYFTSLRNFYQEDYNDKLMLGLMALNMVLPGNKQNLNKLELQYNHSAGAATIESVLEPPYNTPISYINEEATPLTLQSIYNNLIDNWNDGEIDIFKALPNTYFEKFFNKIVGNQFIVLVHKDDIQLEEKEGIVTKVVLQKGVTNAFVSEFSIGINFVSLYEHIVSEVVCRALEPWTLDGVPWMGFENPGFSMKISESEMLVQGAVVGKIKGTNLNIEIPYPVQDNQWLVTGNFDKPYPGISTFYQMAGGVNLVNELPSPLNSLAGFGLSKSEIVFNVESKTIDYMLFAMQTQTPWVFLKTPEFEIQPKVNAVVFNATDLVTRTYLFEISGEFTIGDGIIAVNAQFPSFVLTASLIQNQIKLEDLCELFGVKIDLKSVVTSFDMFMRPSSSIYNIQSEISSDWPINILGVTLFNITGLNFNVEGSGEKNFVSLSGDVVILPDSDAIKINLSAVYDTKSSWIFAGKQTSGQLPLGKLIKEYLGWKTGQDLGIDGLGVIIQTQGDVWEFTGKTAKPWEITPLNLSVGGKLKMGNAKEGKYGEISADIKWNNIALTVFYNYKPNYNAYGIIWGDLTGKIEEKEVKVGKKKEMQQIATLTFKNNITLGEIVEQMITWATGSTFGLSAPWDLLNKVSLGNLSLTYNFTTETVSFEVAINTVNLGIANVEGISIVYGAKKGETKKSVSVNLKGMFLWKDKPSEPLSWDAAKPEETPTPPGKGNKYLDVRLLAMGQHVLLNGGEPIENIKSAIEAMAKLPDTKPGELPNITFSSESSWLFGADFGVMRLDEGDKTDKDAKEDYLLTLQAIFNDPQLYGLRVALAGKPAKIFAGLDFEVRYQRINDGLGVYQVDLTLPTAMRRFDVGAYSVTLPSAGVEVFTNGDFKIDLGFPWEQNFSRSFSIEAIVPPGIPLLGSGGIYFGKLSSGTSTDVPKVTNGTFNPVLVFGMGMQLGLGKSIDAGILKAGFSLTVIGIIEGVLAKWNPYPNEPSLPVSSESDQLQGNYYFRLRGTLGVEGKVFGSVDFVVIKASVNVGVKLLLQADYKAYESMAISVIASVKASASVKIVFVKVSFSFSTSIKETFTIENKGTAPWNIQSIGKKGILAKGVNNRLWALKSRPRKNAFLNLSNLQAPAAKIPLTGYISTGLSIAGDLAGNDPSKQLSCYVLMLFIESIAPASENDQSALLKAIGEKEDSSFEILCKEVLLWLVAAIQGKTLDVKAAEELIVTQEDLKAIEELLLVSPENSTPITSEVIEKFLEDRFEFTVETIDPDKQKEEVNGTIFPVPGSLELEIPKYGSGYSGYNYTFGDYNVLTPNYVNDLNAYFAKLQVEVEPTKDSEARNKSILNKELSMSDFVFGDYFLLLARQMVKNALAGLRNFKYPINEEETLEDIISWVNEKMNSATDVFTINDLITANPTHELQTGQKLNIGHSYQTQSQDSFDSLAKGIFKNQFTAYDLIASNLGNQNIIASEKIITFKEKIYTTQMGDTIASIIEHFSNPDTITLLEFINDSNLVESSIFRENQTLFLPEVRYQTSVSSSFNSISSLENLYKGKINTTLFAQLNGGVDILREGSVIRYSGEKSYTIKKGDLLIDIALKLGVPFANLINEIQDQDIIRPLAVVIIPVFEYVITQGNTFNTIAEHYNVSLELLGRSNATKNYIFDTGQTYLNLPHLPQFEVGELLKEIQYTYGIGHLSGMASRYYLNGLSLPTKGINPRHKGMWVTDELKFEKEISIAGLYALTGQQFKLPEQIESPFLINIKASDTLSWLRFAGDNQQETQLTIEKGAYAYKQFEAVSSFARKNILKTLGKIGFKNSTSITYPSQSLAGQTIWQAAGEVALAFGQKPEGVPALSLWELPNSIINLPDVERAFSPKTQLQISYFDEASGATLKGDLSYYSWATTIQFSVKKVPEYEFSPSTANTYEITGSFGKDILFLERIISQLKNSEDIDGLYVTYAKNLGNQTNANKGVAIQSGNSSNISIGISQTNLTVETRPPADVSLLASNQELTQKQLLNENALEFLQLLWQANITNQGGYFLFYHNSLNKEGLPNWIFNDNGEATIQLNILYKKPEEQSQNRLKNYFNAIAVGQPIASTQNIFVQVESEVLIQAFKEEDTLATFSYAYRANVGMVAQSNMNTLLDKGVSIVVNNGLYLVQDEKEPSNKLVSIASYFGTTEKEIKEANPLITNWEGLLEISLPLKLPSIILEISSTGRPGDTFSKISNFFSVNIFALAQDNRNVKNIFAKGTKLSIETGPQQIQSLVPSGVLSFEMKRPVIDVPENIDDQNYAENYLLNNFNLLDYRISDNLYFLQSNNSLPTSPLIHEEPKEVKHDKIQTVRLLKEGQDEWDYQLGTPYSRFSKNNTNSGDNIFYNWVGSLLQLNFDWLDLYGNRIITDISGDPTILEEKPLSPQLIQVGYTDELIGINQWPSVSSNWYIKLNDATPKQSTAFFNVNFDVNDYQGLISIENIKEAQITLVFTNKVDEAEAVNLNNYQLHSQAYDTVSINKAELSGDCKSVVLSISKLSLNEIYFVKTKRITSDEDEKTSLDGQAVFEYSNLSSVLSSTVRNASEKALNVYSRILNQLQDSNGITLAVRSSLFHKEEIVLDKENSDTIKDWLVSIQAFILNRAKGETTVSEPVKNKTIEMVLSADMISVNNDIYLLDFYFVIRRDSGVVNGYLSHISAIRESSSPVPIYTGSESDSSRNLTQFATNFEVALEQETHILKIANGVNRNQLSEGGSSADLWVVKLAKDNNSENGISYAVNNSGAPSLFAPKPISTTLESRNEVPIRSYRTGEGFSKEAEVKEFVNVDMDSWVAVFFEAMDTVLTSSFTTAMQILEAKSEKNYLKLLLETKKSLANTFKNLMIPMFDGEINTADEVREAFYQQMLIKLGNAYETKAGIAFSAKVNSGIKESETISPRLFGDISENTEENKDATNALLTSPKLNLKNGDNELSFLMTSSDLVKGTNGEVLANVDLDINYSGNYIEHQIGEIKRVEGFKPSSWLSFVIKENAEQYLKKSLGKFKVPLIIRSYPKLPSMLYQEGRVAIEPEKKIKELNEVTKWDYTFTFSQPFHYPQDVINCKVSFNADVTLLRNSFGSTLFSKLAEFISVYPSIEKDLNEKLAKITIDSKRDDLIKDADIALSSFIDVANAIDEVSKETGSSFKEKAYNVNNLESYSFQIQEGSVGDKVEKTNNEGLEKDTFVTVVSGEPSKEENRVEINISGYESFSNKLDDNSYYLYYRNKETEEVLLASVAEKIKERTVTLKNIEILTYQNATASVYVKRNDGLLRERKVTDSFIYKTKEVKFVNSYLPNISYPNEINVASLGGGKTEKRSLENWLVDMFTSLVKGIDKELHLNFQLNVSYQYKLNEYLDFVELPVLIQPPLDVLIPKEKKYDDLELIKKLSESMNTWFKDNNPSTNNGRWNFNLVIMSSLSKVKMPLLSIDNLILEVKDVSAD